jgi:RecA/RadA recombinase
MSEVEELKNALRKKKQRETPVQPSDLLSTGSTLLNLACSGNHLGGFAKGKYHFLVGDSASGKTWLSLTCLAEAAMNKEFDGYRFIYDNAEDGALMDISRFFGAAVEERLEAPETASGSPVYSETIEDFYYHLDDAVKEETPFIYILDSMDSLSSASEQGKFQEQKTAARKGKTTAGSYGDGKAKTNSSNLRKLMPALRATNSILIIINQTRDNLGFGFEQKTRSGGHALRFYATLEVWTSIKSKMKRTIRGKDREIGIVAKVQVKKNRFTGRLRVVELPLYHSFGIDDVGSCVDYLVAEKHWDKVKNTLQITDFDFTGSRDKVIDYIQENNLENDVAEIVAEVWDNIETECSIKRKTRYK